MIMIKHFLLILILSLTSFAQAERLKNTTYSLEDCISIALKQHQSLKISDAQVDMAEALYMQAMSAYYPKLSAQLIGDRADEDATFSSQGSFQLPPILGGIVIPIDTKSKLYDRDTARATVNLSYPVFTGFKRSAILNQAHKSIQIAEHNRRQTSLEIVRDVKKYFYAAQFALQMEELAKNTLIRFQVLENLTERLYKNNSLKVKKTDYLRIKTTTALSRSMVNETTYARELAHEALGNAMGQVWNSHYQLLNRKTPETLTAELQELIEVAKNFNPEVQQLTLAVQIAADKITEAQSGYYPTIGVQARAHKIWNDFDGGLINKDNNEGWNIGVGLKWDLFSGFETSGRVSHAKAEQRKLSSQKILLDKAMALQVKLQFLRIKNSSIQIKDTYTAYEFAEENSKLHVRAYQHEMVDTKEVVESQLIESFARSAYLRSRYALEMGLTTLEFLIGQNIEKLAPLNH